MIKALRSFAVRPSLPPALAPLQELASNLRWSWDDRAQAVFRWVASGAGVAPATAVTPATGLGPDRGPDPVHDPVRLLATVDAERLDALAADAGFVRHLGDVHAELRRYVEGDRWFQSRSTSPLRRVAYFSPEFGIAEALPQYSGGLGVLAGDHLKSASDLGAPLVGVGLLYRHGYFRQSLGPTGWQQERYPRLDPHAMALAPCDGLRVTVDLAGVPLTARAWRADVGRVPLYLLDTDLDDNAADGRAVTDRLYGGDTEHRLRQEVLLGIGGVRALTALGLDTQVFHTNEGHAGFLGLERIRRAMSEDGLSWPEAIEAVRAGCVFTTHTPVPAGIDRFPRELMAKYFGGWCEEAGVPLDDLLALGRPPGCPDDEPFNMAVMGLRLAGSSNGVAALHGEVSRAMFADLWPDIPTAEVPIDSVTNGVHAPSWVSPEMNDLLGRYVLPEWHDAPAESWARVVEAPDGELWRVREQGRERLVAFVRQHLRAGAAARGASGSDVATSTEVLDPRVLTVGFARRFATYKRATLLLSQPDRLRRLLLDDERPLQMVFAGKAHPADRPGKEMIQQIVRFAADPAVRHRFVFLDDYDIAVARALYQGADVWLNNPRRPQEACGTSGMKSALNGGLNLSILDGWWAEMFDGDNGWAISSFEGAEEASGLAAHHAGHAAGDAARRDQLEADALFELLERQVVPLFYDRAEGRAPRAWARKVKVSLATLGPRVCASRMVRDYVEHLYEPAAARADALGADGAARARGLAAWKRRVTEAWHAVHVEHVRSDGEDDARDDNGAGSRGGGAGSGAGGRAGRQVGGAEGRPVGAGSDAAATGAADTAPTEAGAARRVSAVVALGELGHDDVEVQLLHGPVGAGDELSRPGIAPMSPVAPTDGDHTRYEGTMTAPAAGRYGFTVRVVPRHPDLPSPTDLGLAAWPQ